MIDLESLGTLKQGIREQMLADRALLDAIRAEIRPFKDEVRRIQPRTATAISLVGTDGGNNRIQFDPFLVQLVRVVDSSNNEYVLEVVTPTTDVRVLEARLLDPATGRGRGALGEMMEFLGVKRLRDLSPMIGADPEGRVKSPGWVLTYRELTEWAVLFRMVRTKEFGTDAVLVFDGLLRSKVFATGLFGKLMAGLREAIEGHARQHRRRVFLAGIAKHSQVLTRYRLAMSLERILATEFPAYLEIDRATESKAYVWDEFAKEDKNFVGGRLFFVKFGAGARDSIWPVDLFEPQAAEAQTIFGYLLADAINGFPVPFYPQCLQRAHEHAALVDFDMNLLQDEIFDAIRVALHDDGPVLDAFRLQDADPSSQRYG